MRHLGTYIQVDAEAIEYRNWPFAKARGIWGNVEGLGKIRRYGITWDILRFDEFQVDVIGAKSHKKIRDSLGLSEENYIPLSGFRGWPDGDLYEDIKQYAPQIFTQDGL